MIRNNRITNTGYFGIVPRGQPLGGEEHHPRRLGHLNDGGGIYWDNSDGMIIQDNIVEDLDRQYGERGDGLPR